MKLHVTCREATQLVLEGQDRRLSALERLTLRLHMAICETCPRFVRQVRLMQAALGRWKRGDD